MDPYNLLDNFRKQEENKAKRETEKKKEKRESLRFWLTFSVTAVAALASLAGVLLQIAK